MNISKVLHQTPPKFEPYTLQIQVESYTDHLILKKLSATQYSIPQVMYPNDVHMFTLSQSFLNKLLQALK